MIDLLVFVIAFAAVGAILALALWAVFAAMHQLLVWANEFIDIFTEDDDDPNGPL